MFDFLTNNDVLGGITASWLVFLWAGGFTLILAIFTSNSIAKNKRAEENLVRGSIKSLAAGVFEEICFRWAVFLGATIGLQVTNWLLFGWVDGLAGPVKWLHEVIFGPIATFMTLGKAEDLMLGMGWVVGAAILAANAKFRDGHKYLGFIGFVNSWYIGIFLFYIVFTYGLLAAIVVHFLYNLLIEIIIYVDSVIERQLMRKSNHA